jgi:hypothetical protein
MNIKISIGFIGCVIALSMPVLPCMANTTTSLQVKYTLSADSYFQKRDEYFIELLKLAAEKSNKEIHLVPITLADQVETRDIINLNKGIIDIHWMHTSNVLESKLIPIRIPLEKGLFGWRVMLLEKSNQQILQNVNDVSGLKRHTFLQGYDWPDTGILLANGFKVETSTSFRGRFRMLERKRGDLFPRSILEAWEEVKNQANTRIVVDPYILLYYPTAVYFFVAENNQPLHDAIEVGLELSIADGSFDKLFQRYYGEAIKRAELENRTIITIPNPKLPSLTPLQRKELWLLPEDYADLQGKGSVNEILKPITPL